MALTSPTIARMRYLADLHIHSRFSRATSRDLDLSRLHSWAQRKGLTVLGTGDFTHPAWRAELGDQLERDSLGMYKLKEGFIQHAHDVPQSCQGEVRFIFQAEISTIYKRDDAVRKVHHVVLAPDFEGAERLSQALEKVGNVSSDGRPILGLDSRDLLEMVLEHGGDGACLIPAHIWTPWFSLLGSKSGFDRIDECYRDLSGHIFALETGLSSDPAMNHRVSALDRYTLVSNSDAHSPSKLGRECNVFDTPLVYDALVGALKRRDPYQFLGTIEFFPEEGKYHLDGHRKCSARLTPTQTLEAKALCPSCGRKVTVGVSHRVEELADRAEGEKTPQPMPPFSRLISLAESVGAALGRGPATVGVGRVVEDLCQALGPELHILQAAPVEDIKNIAGEVVAEAVHRVRAEEIRWEAGYDGEYGVFEVFSPQERAEITHQQSLFHEPKPQRKAPRKRKTKKRKTAPKNGAKPSVSSTRSSCMLDGLCPEQLEAVLAPSQAPLLVVAGPGTGKTRTLTTRIAHKIKMGERSPSEIVALTFTNRAAAELRERLDALVKGGAQGLWAMTFHALGLELLRGVGGFEGRIAEERERRQILADLGTRGTARRLSYWVSRVKNGSLEPATDKERTLLEKYDETLKSMGCVDIDDLVLRAAELAEDKGQKALLPTLRAVFVDEYQDVNPVQVRLLKALVTKGVELTAIGDPDQAIYSFRGADPSRIERFASDWPEPKIVSLDRSYRSSDTVLQAASEVIAPAQRAGLGRGKLWSGISGQPKVWTLSARSERAEAEAIAMTVERLLGGTTHFSFDSGLVESEIEGLCQSFGEIAVVYRLRRQGQAIAKALRRLGLPVRWGVPQNMVDPKADVLVAALKCLAGRATAPDQALAQGLPLSELDQSAVTLSAAAAVTAVRGLLEPLDAEQAESIKPIEKIAKTVDKPQSVARFLDRKTRPLDQLLDWLVLHKEADLTDQKGEHINLLTIHASKGLEWKVVFIAGCEDGLLPYRRPSEPADLDEERRLMFVAMTRARELLVLAQATARSPAFGPQKSQPTAPSPFLAQISPSLLHIAHEGEAKEQRRHQQLSLFD